METQPSLVEMAVATIRRLSNASIMVANEDFAPGILSDDGGQTPDEEAIIDESESLLRTPSSGPWKAPRGFLWIEAGMQSLGAAAQKEMN